MNASKTQWSWRHAKETGMVKIPWMESVKSSPDGKLPQNFASPSLRRNKLTAAISSYGALIMKLPRYARNDEKYLSFGI